MLENRHFAKQTCCKTDMLENRYVAKQTCWKTDMLQNRHVGKQTSCKTDMLQNRLRNKIDLKPFNILNRISLIRYHTKYFFLTTANLSQ